MLLNTNMMQTNPLLKESELAYQFPRFDLIRDEDVGPALKEGMVEELREIDAIAKNSDLPTFENTIVALERSGKLRKRVDRYFGNLVSANTSPVLEKLDRDTSAERAAHRDAIQLNPALFARIDALHTQRGQITLDAESRYLLERYYKDYVRAGAKLPEPAKERLRAINEELASLATIFDQNVLAERNASSLVIESRDELAGLPEAEIAAAASAASDAGKAGKWVLTLLNTTTQPAMAYLQNRSVRQRLLAVSESRNHRGGNHDNREIVTRMARLRAERANLLGFSTHADYVIDDQTAGSTARVEDLVKKLAPAAVANARREAAEIQDVIDRERGGFQVSAADWDFYSEKVRLARFDFDESRLRPYFEVNRVLMDGVFFAASRLYGIAFKERKDLPVYHPDVRVFEVFDSNGQSIALFIADLYARPAKRGGAWMNSFVPQSVLLGTKPVVSNNLNIPKPRAGDPTLLTLDEVTTMFHEFGHALHGMFSGVRYPRFSGTQVPRDFVEFPSQVNEMWALWPEVLRNYAKHYQTSTDMPTELAEKAQAARAFNQGYMTTEYLASTLLDLAWHTLSLKEVPADAEAFEQATLRKAGLDFAPVPPRYHSTYFAHVFSGNYSAGYYSYIWAEVLDADTVEWIREHGGLLRENGDRFRATVLSRGGSDDAMTLFRNFTGAEPQIEPLLKRRGLEPQPSR